MTAARILVVDDHPLAREGLKSILRGAGYEVVAEAATGEAAIAAAGALKPDVVLLDIRLGDGIDGLQAAAAIRALDADIRVIMLTLHDAPGYVRAALEAGASGYVLKDAGLGELRLAVDQVLAGRLAIPASLASAAFERPERTGTDPAAFGRLTGREREVLDLVSEGLTNKEIARRLDISPATVKAHVERVIAKLGVADRTQAAVQAARLRQAGD
ncbi:MAG: response regulator transcription factor [Alphaproteobacteria bacterium]|nr:response regulator transcription factor [Alphaproteobacteria bacterium]